MIILPLLTNLACKDEVTESSMMNVESEGTPETSNTNTGNLDTSSCRSHLSKIIKGEEVIGNSLENLVVVFAGTGTSAGGMANYLFDQQPSGYADSPKIGVMGLRNVFEIKINQTPSNNALSNGRKIAREYNATFVFPDRIASQWPNPDEARYMSKAVDYTNCLSALGFNNVFTLGYSNGTQTAGAVALVANKRRGVAFTGPRSLFDAASSVGVSDVSNSLTDIKAAFAYYKGDELLGDALSNFKKHQKSHSQRFKVMEFIAREKSPSAILRHHVTGLGSNGMKTRTIMSHLIAN